MSLESVLVLILLLEIIAESVLGQLVDSTIFTTLMLLGTIYLVLFKVDFTKSTIFSIALSMTLLLSTIINVNRIESGGYSALTILSVTLILLSSKLKRIDFSDLLVKINFVAVLFLVGIYTFYLFQIQFSPSHLSYILAGPYSNQNTTAMICFGLIVLIINFNIRNSRISYVIIALLFFSIILTQSRAAMLCALLILVYTFRKRLISILLLGIFSLVSFFYYNQDSLNRIYSKIFEGTSSNRIDFWIEVVNNMTETPGFLLFGSGVNTTVMALDGVTLSVHNAYVNYFANYGILSLYLLSLYVLFIVFDSYRKSVRLCVSLLAIFLYAMFETALFTGFSILWLSLVYLYILRDQFKQ